MNLNYFQLTSISPEALSQGVGGIKEVVRLNDEIPGAELLNQMPVMVDELGLPTFTIPEGVDLSLKCLIYISY